MITGFLFVLGAFSCAYLWEELVEQKREPKYEHVENPSGIIILNSAKRDDAIQFTVVGTLENKSAFFWRTLQIEVKLYVDSFQVGSCNSSRGIASNLKPGEKRDFQVECRNTDGSGEPSSFNYTVEVVHGRREAGE